MTSNMQDMYSILSVSQSATDTEIRRAYRNLITKEHPDKGGDAERFKLIQKAYELLSNTQKRKLYDETGKVQMNVDEEFMDMFAGGNFRDRSQELLPKQEDQLARKIEVDFGSHTAGFEAWMRSRSGADQVFTAENIAEQFGVVKSSYTPRPLPNLTSYQVVCSISEGKPDLQMKKVDLSSELEWGEVLVGIRYAPINPADLYTIQTGGLYADQKTKTPFIPGHDFVGVVSLLGPGVKDVEEGDWVVSARPFMGGWRAIQICKSKDLIVIPKTFGLPLEYVSMYREMVLAYRLIEDRKNLKPGDCVILNAANSTVGQILIQICNLLHLRTIAVIRKHDEQSFERTSNLLKNLGATAVVVDDGTPVISQLENQKYFAKPKVAFDAVGGESAVRISGALQDKGEVIIYGCISGKAPTWPWHQWVFREIQVKGFNIRNQMQTKNNNQLQKILQQLGKLVEGQKLSINYTEYELASEFWEALDHAKDVNKNTKVLLKIVDTGTLYDN